MEAAEVIPADEAELEQVPNRVDLGQLALARRVYFLMGRFRVWTAYVEVFERDHGRILRAFYSNASLSAVVLTDGLRANEVSLDRVPELLYEPPGELSPEFTQVLFEADQVLFELKQSRAISPKRMELSFEMIHSALTYLFKLADHDRPHGGGQRGKGGPPRTIPASAYAVANAHLRSARRYYLTGELRWRTLMYMAGMVYVSVILGVLAGVALAFGPSRFFGSLPVDLGLLATSLVAGGLGSIFSVMIRMSRGELLLSRDLSRFETALVGGFRPLIGVMSGGLLYVVILSGLLPIRPSGSNLSTQASTFGFYAILAFIAGFSERFVQDALTRTESQFSAQLSAPDQKGADTTPSV